MSNRFLIKATVSATCITIFIALCCWFADSTKGKPMRERQRNNAAKIEIAKNARKTKS